MIFISFLVRTYEDQKHARVGIQILDNLKIRSLLLRSSSHGIKLVFGPAKKLTSQNVRPQVNWVIREFRTKRGFKNAVMFWRPQIFPVANF